jgi:hypothetical protein
MARNAQRKSDIGRPPVIIRAEVFVESICVRDGLTSAVGTTLYR